MVEELKLSDKPDENGIYAKIVSKVNGVYGIRLNVWLASFLFSQPYYTNCILTVLHDTITLKYFNKIDSNYTSLNFQNLSSFEVVKKYFGVLFNNVFLDIFAQFLVIEWLFLIVCFEFGLYNLMNSSISIAALCAISIFGVRKSHLHSYYYQLRFSDVNCDQHVFRFYSFYKDNQIIEMEQLHNFSLMLEQLKTKRANLS